MHSYKVVSFIILITFIASITPLLSQTEEGYKPYFNTSEKFDERGFMKASSSLLDGNEIIGDYDGNLQIAFSSRLNIPNNLGGDVTLIYNSNVEHRFFLLPCLGFNDDGYPVNAPEWILGYKGFALQTFNYETNYYMHREGSEIRSGLVGEETPLLIPGYHYTNPYVKQNTGQSVYNRIELLLADGSVMKLYGCDDHSQIGTFIEGGSDAKTFACVDYKDNTNTLRKMNLYKGDGLCYYFEEDYVNYHENEVINGIGQVLNARVMYLRKIYYSSDDEYGRNLDINYTWDNTHPWGRKSFINIETYLPGNQNWGLNKWQVFRYVTDIHEISLNYNYGQEVNNAYMFNAMSNERFYIALQSYCGTGIFSASRSNVPGSSKIHMVKKITDKGLRTTEFFYRNERRKYGYEVTPTQQTQFGFTHFARLPDSVIYYTGRRTRFTYVEPSDMNSYYDLELNLRYFHGITGISADYLRHTFRDNYTNFMVSERTISEKIDNEYSPKLRDSYLYLLGDGSNQYFPASLAEVTGIMTMKTTHNLSSGNSAPDIIVNEKEFNRIKTPHYPFYMDGGPAFATKCVYEKTSSGQSAMYTEIRTDYTDYTVWPSKITTQIVMPHENGIDTKQINEKEFFYNSTDLIRYGIKEIILKKKETIVESDDIVTETVFLDTISSDMFYLAEVPIENKVSFGDDIKSHTITEYFDVESENRGKIKRIINFPGNRPDTTEYEYYDLIESKFYGGLPKSEFHSNGLRKYFSYPKPAPGYAEHYVRMVLDTARAKVKLIDGRVIIKDAVTDNFQTVPFKTTICNDFSKDTLVTEYRRTDENGRPLWEIDPNGYYSEYKYDSLGRVTRINLPGSFFETNRTDSIFYQAAISSPTARNFSLTLPSEISEGVYKAQSFNAYSTGGNDPDGAALNNDASTIDQVIGKPRFQDYRYFTFLKDPMATRNITELEAAQLKLRTKERVSENCDVNYFKLKGIGRCIDSARVIYMSLGTVYVSFQQNSLLDIDVKPIIEIFRQNNETLYGFSIEAGEAIGNSMVSFVFSRDTLPTLAYRIMFVNVDTNASARSTISYRYYDCDNRVETIKRLSYSEDKPKEIKTVAQLGSDGKARRILQATDEGMMELKGRSNINYMGLCDYSADAMGRETFTSYDGLGRPVKIQHEINQEAEIKKEINYDISDVENALVTTVTDEENKVSATYNDKNGLKIRDERVNDGETLTTYYTYDNFRRLNSVTSPEEKITTYSYDSHGNLASKTTPDDGTFLYYYNAFGDLRYVTHDDGGPWKIQFCGYDPLKRLLVKGLGTVDDLGSLQPDNLTDALAENDTANYIVVNMYDTLVFSGVFGTLSRNEVRIDGANENMRGRLCATAYRDRPGEPWSYKVYGYDALGNISRCYMKFRNLPWKLIKTDFDNAGNVIYLSAGSHGQRADIERMYYWYNYDCQGRIIHVCSSLHDLYATSRVDAVYNYNAADQLITTAFTGFGDGKSTQTRTYDNRGRIQTMNSAFLQQAFTYYNNNNIQSNTMTWNIPAAWNQTAAMYAYDGLNRLTAVSTNGDVFENFRYDKDGNLLLKNNERGQKSFFYSTGTNHLLYKMSQTVGSDMMEAGLTYDQKGNVFSDEGRCIDSIHYDERNLPLTMYIGKNVTNYCYDDQGNRIYKETNEHHTLRGEYYLLDASGRELAIYKIEDNGIDSLKSFSLFGPEGRIGHVNVNIADQNRTDEPFYYITDHLGSVKVTVNAAGEAVFAEDTYAFGGIIRHYDAAGVEQKYDFTGKERDAESGLHYFGARYYDSDDCRWLSVDPLADKYPGWSPYNYCMNNPRRVIDPQGKDIIVLMSPKGAHGFSHGAVLIGNDEKGWQYYAKDGTVDGISGVYGNPMKGEGRYSNLTEFSEEVNFSDIHIDKPYTEAYRITADEETDNKMKIAAQVALNSKYNLFTGKHCWGLVSDALAAGGFNDGTIEIVLRNRIVKGQGILPKERFSRIKTENVGKDVSHYLHYQRSKQQTLYWHSISNQQYYEILKANAGL